MTLTFFVPGIPVPKQRARTVRTKTGKVRSYTPPRTERWEASVRVYAMRACGLAGWKPTDAPCEVELTVHRARRIGDADNFAKAFTDACNGVLYIDDRHIRRLAVTVVDGCEKTGILAKVSLTARANKGH